jgi:DNA polymerase-3 subunit gamma/tau
MAYQVLARKWRPQEFSALIGQEPIVTALRNALVEGRIAQAYLFSGIRGVGKTTAARLLAKCLNCEQGPTPTPCNQCRQCREIAGGSDLDVIEVDAATYSKVEQVRELTESLRYGPSADRYKVVVIDEIHRLSRQAFDALLKIVEEPPSHLTFIFATTEVDAVPATLLSRCQEFHFRRVPVEPLTAHLRQVAAAEEIEASDTALRLIARAGEGSVRDAVALLDQLATFGSGTIADADAVRLLGGLDTALFHRLLEAILTGRSDEVAAVVLEIEDQGWDPRSVYSQFLAYVRDALHIALGASRERIDLPGEEVERLEELLRGSRYEDLLRLLNLLVESEETVRRTEAGALALEIAWLRGAELPKLIRVEALLAGGDAVPGDAAPGGMPPGRGGAGGRGAAAQGGARAAAPEAAGAGRPRAAGAASSRNERPAAAAKSAEGAASAAPETSAAAAAAGGNGRLTESPGNGSMPPTEAPQTAAPTSGEDGGAVGAPRADVSRAVVEEVSRRRQSLAAHLESARSLELDGSTLCIGIPPGDELIERALSREANRSILDEVVTRLWGAEARWTTVVAQQEVARLATPGDPGGNGRAPGGQPVAAGVDEIAAHPTVQTVLDIFGGSVEAVEPRAEPRASED